MPVSSQTLNITPVLTDDGWRFNSDGVYPDNPPAYTVITYADRTKTVTAAAAGGGSGTDGSPWTLAEAMANAVAGDIVGVGAGVYVGSQTAGDDAAKRYSPAWRSANSGSEVSPIYFVAQNFAALTDTDVSDLRSGATTSGDGWPAFGNLDKDHVFWLGFKSSEAETNNKPREDSAPAILWGSTGGGIQYCNIIGEDVSWTDNHSGVRCEGASGGIVSDNKIYNFRTNGGGSTNCAGVLTYSCANMEYSYNFIDYCGNNIFWKAGTPQYGMKAHHNVFSRGVDAFRIQLLTDTVRNEIYQNIFLDYGTSAIYFSQTAVPNDLPINLVVANNIFYDKSTAYAHVGTFRYDKNPYTTTTNHMWNNIILNTNSSPVISSGFITDAAVVAAYTDHQNNCYYNYGSAWGGSDGGAGTLRSLTVGDWQSTYGMDIDSVFADPVLVDAANEDYRLDTGSPCFDAGADILQLNGGLATDTINIGVHVSASQNETFGVRGASLITLLRVVDFNGLADGQSVLNHFNNPGSTEGKRFDWTLNNWGYRNGYGIQATTSVKSAGKTSSCAVSIANGSDGSGTPTDGCWGGSLELGADSVAEGEEIWYGMRVMVPSSYNWNHGAGASKPGYIKFMRVNNTSNGQRIEHHVTNGSWSGDAAADNLQIGWSLANEFDPKAQAETHKKTQEILTLDEWIWVEFYIYAHSNPALAKRRLWVNDSLVFERVGADNKWVDQNGDVQTETLSSGEKSLPDSGATLDSVMHGTYWNGDAPQDQTYYIQHIGYHKDVNDLIATDQFGNKMIGSGGIA